MTTNRTNVGRGNEASVTRRSWLKLVGGAVPLIGGCAGRGTEAALSGASGVVYGYGGESVGGVDGGGKAALSGDVSTATADSVQRPYMRTIPGRIQAQNFDTGGEGVSYHDTTEGNKGDAYRRSTGVDIESTRDASGAYNVGWIADGEWLEYTLRTVSGTFEVNLRVASPDGGASVRLSLDGTAIGSVDVPATGGWQNWQTVTLSDVRISGDTDQTLRATAVGGGFNINWIEFTSSDSTPITATPTPTPDDGQEPFGGSPPTLPGLVEAENFDTGGEGIAYHDGTDANQGGVYRDEGVDIESTSDGAGYNLAWIRGDEWFEYTVRVPEGNYDVQLRVASPYADGKLRVSLDGDPLGTAIVPDTGGWQRWSTVTLTDVTVSGSGDRVLRAEIPSGAGRFNLNWLRFVDTGETTSGTDTTETPADDYGEQGYGQYGYGGVTT